MENIIEKIEIYFGEEKSRYIIDENLDVYNDRGRKIKPILWSQGRYEMYSFNHKGKKVRRLRHRLIGEYFIPLPEGYDIKELQINHIDGNKINNALKNLEWVTEEENIKHSFNSGLSKTGGTPYKKLKVRDTVTGEEEIFPSLRQASLKKKISIASLSEKSRVSCSFKIKHFEIEMLDCDI